MLHMITNIIATSTSQGTTFSILMHMTLLHLPLKHWYSYCKHYKSQQVNKKKCVQISNCNYCTHTLFTSAFKLTLHYLGAPTL